MSLSKTQKEAVEYIKNPLIVVASAGSGKTRVITYKFAHLINNLNYNSKRILCVTFTNKAANELKERLVKLTNKSIEEFPWVKTIHSACLLMLKPFLNYLEFNENITIFSDYDQKKIINKIVQKYDNLKEVKTFEIKSLISSAKNSIDPIEELKLKEDEYKNITNLFFDYCYELKNNNSLDYDDILWFTYYLLKNNRDFLLKYRNLFNYIMVDEYQDINNIQNQIIKMLLGKNNHLTVVGDDSQSIYAFRKSDPSFFINFSNNFPDSHIIKLEQNYRSVKKIVELSDNLIKNNTIQIRKKCFSQLESEKNPCIVKFHSTFDEAKAISLSCKKYHNEFNIPYSEMAILYRIRFMSRALEEQLIKNKIPYKIVGSLEFFERHEIKDILSYIRFICNLKDKIAFERVLNSPKRGIGEKTIEIILNCPGDNILEQIKYSIKNNKVSKKQKKILKDLIYLIDVNIDLEPKIVLDNIFVDLNFSEYLDKISNNQDELNDRINNIKELINYSSNYKTLGHFNEECSLLINKDEENLDRINLMTIHASKGLEFKVVFIVGLEDGILPHSLSIKDDIENNTIKNIEEERRLFYVAITRSKEILNITYCKKRMDKFYNKSRFIKEIKEFCTYKDLTKEKK